MTDDIELRFEASLPANAETPVKPTTDRNPLTGKRRVRIWLDAYLSPGETEKFLLMGDGANYEILARRVERPVDE